MLNLLDSDFVDINITSKKKKNIKKKGVVMEREVKETKKELIIETKVELEEIKNLEETIEISKNEIIEDVSQSKKEFIVPSGIKIYKDQRKTLNYYYIPLVFGFVSIHNLTYEVSGNHWNKDNKVVFKNKEKVNINDFLTYFNLLKNTDLQSSLLQQVARFGDASFLKEFKLILKKG